MVRWSVVVVLGLLLPAELFAQKGGIHRGTTSQLLTTFKSLESATEASSVGIQQATFGTGCFWCTEAIFEQLQGVKQVISGFSGGRIRNPTYQQVLTGRTGHAEVVHIEYDASKITYGQLLEAFWLSHDPTTLNRQGVDIGTQYRSAIFYHDDGQREAAVHYKMELNKSKAFRDPIVTEITPFEAFYPAETYHQDYFALNGKKSYCRVHIRPKLKKFKRVFREHLKE